MTTNNDIFPFLLNRSSWMHKPFIFCLLSYAAAKVIRVAENTIKTDDNDRKYNADSYDENDAGKNNAYTCN